MNFFLFSEAPAFTDHEEQELEKGKDKKKKKKDKNRTKTKNEKVEGRSKPAEEEHKVRKTTPVTGESKAHVKISQYN